MTCGTCSYYDKDSTKSFYSNAGYCSWYQCYYYPDEASCSHYSPSTDGGFSFCYITTIVHKILGLEDNSVVLDTLRDLRDNVMEKDEKYKELLFEYDVIGPRIAERLEKDNDKVFCNYLLNKYLAPICRMIKEKKYMQATINYENLTTSLALYYNINYMDLTINNNYDYTKGGHGRVYCK